MSTPNAPQISARIPDPKIFEAFLAAVMGRFQRLPAEAIDAAINETLKGTAEALQVDRISLVQFSRNGELLVTHSWGRDGAPPLSLNFDVSQAPWSAGARHRARGLEFPGRPVAVPEPEPAGRPRPGETGMKSHTILPLEVDGEIEGCLALGTFGNHRALSPALLGRIEVLVSILAGALHRARVEKRMRAAWDPEAARSGSEAVADLATRSRLTAKLGEIGPRFQRLPAAQLATAIRAALQEVLEAVDMDRISITEFSREASSHLFSYAYWRPGLPPTALGVNRAVAFPRLGADEPRSRRLVFSRLPQDLPEASRAEFAPFVSLGMKSLVLLPLDDEGASVGYLALSSFREHRQFSVELQTSLDLLASIFASALQRSRMTATLRDAERFSRALLSALPVAAAVLDRQGRLLMVNQAWSAPARPPGCLGIRSATSEEIELTGPSGTERRGEVHEAIRAVLSDRAAPRELTLPCECESRKSVYRLGVTPIHTEAGGVLITRADVTEIEETRAALEESLAQQRVMKERLQGENAILARDLPRSNDFGEIVGRTPALSVLLEQVRRVASTDAPVLVLGETGTGKGLVARALHDRSPRRTRPLVTVNCAALPPTLIDSELFGYEKGAFTGAIARTPGRFEVADRGTLLLDEIGELPLDLQAKLLRVLQSGEFERLGSSKTLRVDVRLIAATNRDLEREVREGRFRADLFYRLSVFPLTLPPLRNRPEDIPLLVWHCIARRQAPLGRRIARVPERVMRAFCAYSWPGNIRELENVVERALILSDGATLATDPMFLGGVRRDAEAASAGSLSDVERQYILEVLQHCGWKVAGKGNAADRLGLNRSTLLSRMKKLGINRPDLEDRQQNRTESGAGQRQARPPGVSVAR